MHVSGMYLSPPPHQVWQTVGLLSAAVRGDLTRLEEMLAPRTELLAVVRNTRRQAEAVAHTLGGLPFWGDAGSNPSQLAEYLAFLEEYRSAGTRQ